MKSEEKFWNDPVTIKWFSEQPVPDYWVIFFKDKRRKIKRVLDLGCGAGRNTQFLFELRFDVYACDWYKEMVKTARERLYKVGIDKTIVENRVIKASMLNLPYDSSFFDVVLSNGVFHNAESLKDIELAISETGRVLRKNGYVCFNLFSSSYIDPSLKKVSDNVYLTNEKLPMVLISRVQLINFFKKYGLIPDGDIAEYEREVTTGKRSVMRGVFKKI